MSNNTPIDKLPGATDFESRVLSALADLQHRLTNVEECLTALEAKSYDTKPIWERALAEILQVRQEQVRTDVQLDRIESMTNQTRAEMLTLRADFKEVLHHNEAA